MTKAKEKQLIKLDGERELVKFYQTMRTPPKDQTDRIDQIALFSKEFKKVHRSILADLFLQKPSLSLSNNQLSFLFSFRHNRKLLNIPNMRIGDHILITGKQVTPLNSSRLNTSRRRMQPLRPANCTSNDSPQASILASKTLPNNSV